MSDAHRTIPAAELYWAVLTPPPPAMARTARAGEQIVSRTEGLDELLAEYLPVGIDTVKAAYAALDAADGKGVRVLAAAVARDRLAAGGAAGAGVTVVTPDAVPDGVVGEAGGVEPEQLITGLNFLWGDLEPAPVVGARRRATTVAAAVVIVVAAAAVVGLERRAASLRAGAAEHRAQASGVLAELYRKPTVEAGRVALDQELSRVARTRAPRPNAVNAGDAADSLQSLLMAWPRSEGAAPTHRLRTESLTATPDNLSLVVALEDRSQVGPLSEALRGIAGWKLGPPAFTAAPMAGGSGAGTEKVGGGTLNVRLTVDPSSTAATPSGVGGSR